MSNVKEQAQEWLERNPDCMPPSSEFSAYWIIRDLLAALTTAKDAHKHLLDKYEILERERERYNAVLEEIAEMTENDMGIDFPTRGSKIAREALKRGGK